MRINIYSQELTDECRMLSKESNTGITYHAVQIMLHSSSMRHHPPEDDDRSAVTFWLPKSDARRRNLADTLNRMAQLILEAPSATGLD